MADWDIALGTTLLRSELHDRWKGGRYGGIEPSVPAESVFLFTNPRTGRKFGYNFDGWHEDGTYHYTGDGQVGDQSPDIGGNRSLLEAAGRGRTVRLFRSDDREVTYLGAFSVAGSPAYERNDAEDRSGEPRSVLVFRLNPVGEVIRDPSDVAPPELSGPEEIPVETVDVDEYAAQRPQEPRIAVRREAQLVQQYAAWLASRGEQTSRHRIPISGGAPLYTDVFNKTTGELVEAKASAARVYVRAALGQILDYSRFLDHQARSLLLPVRPSDDLLTLLHQYGVGVIWQDGRSFERSDP